MIMTYTYTRNRSLVGQLGPLSECDGTIEQNNVRVILNINKEQKQEEIFIKS